MLRRLLMKAAHIQLHLRTFNIAPLPLSFSEDLTHTWKPCVTKGMRRCLIETETSFEAQANAVNPNFYYTECYEKQSCDSEMFQRFIDYGKAMKAEKPNAKSTLTP